MHLDEDAPLSPIPNTTDRSPTAEGSAVGAAGYQPYEHMPGSLSMADLDEGEERAARRRDASSTSSSFEDSARKNSPGTKRGSVYDAIEKSIPASKVEPVDGAETSPRTKAESIQDAAEKDSLASDRGSVQDVYKASADTTGGSLHVGAGKGILGSKFEPVDVAETSPYTKAESVQGAAEKDSLASDRGSVQDVYKASADTTGGSLHVGAGKGIPASNVEAVQDVDKISPRTERRSIHNAAESSANSGRDSIRNLAEKRSESLSSGPTDDTVKTSASASDHGLIESAANWDETEIPVAYESAVTDVPLKEEKPATPTVTPISPLMDRVSIPSHPVPYYATPKIMVHRPSQSSEENLASRTIDEVLANERQSMPQETIRQPPHSAPDDAKLIDEAPMQTMSLKPIAWQAPKNQKLQKRKLYLRKIRNAAARKTILKATLGRQLAAPTKQMLRLLANGENLTIPDVSKSSVEAATMLVPQEAVGSVTGAVLLPQGVGGAVPDE